jgi:hypothetical protein
VGRGNKKEWRRVETGSKRNKKENTRLLPKQ